VLIFNDITMDALFFELVPIVATKIFGGILSRIHKAISSNNEYSILNELDTCESLFAESLNNLTNNFIISFIFLWPLMYLIQLKIELLIKKDCKKVRMYVSCYINC